MKNKKIEQNKYYVVHGKYFNYSSKYVLSLAVTTIVPHELLSCISHFREYFCISTWKTVQYNAFKKFEMNPVISTNNAWDRFFSRYLFLFFTELFVASSSTVELINGPISQGAFMYKWTFADSLCSVFRNLLYD